MACELPAKRGVPLSRWSSDELAREAVGRGIVEQISGVTVWRWLSQDAIKPYQHRSWIFPRDPNFAERAAPILDLYAGQWQGERLHPGDYVICADEKPSIQARHNNRCEVEPLQAIRKHQQHIAPGPVQAVAPTSRQNRSDGDDGVLEPIWEAKFQPCSYGFRPNRRAQDAIEQVRFFINPPRSYEWATEEDVEDCFGSIHQGLLLAELRLRVTDKRVLRLIRQFLGAGIMRHGSLAATPSGTPQGAIL